MPPWAVANEPGLVAIGAGKRAALVAEQLALEQIAGDCGAVDGGELAGRPLRRCTSRATTSLPVPLSPSTSTLSCCVRCGEARRRCGRSDSRRPALRSRRSAHRVAQHRSVDAVGDVARCSCPTNFKMASPTRISWPDSTRVSVTSRPSTRVPFVLPRSRRTIALVAQLSMTSGDRRAPRRRHLPGVTTDHDSVLRDRPGRRQAVKPSAYSSTSPGPPRRAGRGRLAELLHRASRVSHAPERG